MYEGLYECSTITDSVFIVALTLVQLQRTAEEEAASKCRNRNPFVKSKRFSADNFVRLTVVDPTHGALRRNQFKTDTQISARTLEERELTAWDGANAVDDSGALVALEEDGDDCGNSGNGISGSGPASLSPTKIHSDKNGNWDQFAANARPTRDAPP